MLLKDCEDNLKKSNCDSLQNRQFNRLLPRPTASINNSASCCVIPSYYFNHKSNKIGFSIIHRQSCSSNDQPSKNESHMQPLVSSRWNPTPEQLMALEEMYRRGVKTPSAEEIKLIAARLRQFGKIEGKNVFYWFQNHKARERQKRRRQPDSMSKKHENDIETLETKETGISSKALGAEQNKKLVTIPTSSSTSKECVSMQRSVVTESGDGWPYPNERESHQMSQRKIAKGETTLTNLSCMASNSNLSNSITVPSTPETSAKAQQKLFNSLNFGIFSPSCNEDVINYEDRSKDHQTLQLFPPRKDDHCAIRATESEFKEIMTTINSTLPPNQFYQFL